MSRTTIKDSGPVNAQGHFVTRLDLELFVICMTATSSPGQLICLLPHVSSQMTQFLLWVFIKQVHKPLLFLTTISAFHSVP